MCIIWYCLYKSKSKMYIFICTQAYIIYHVVYSYMSIQETMENIALVIWDTWVLNSNLLEKEALKKISKREMGRKIACKNTALYDIITFMLFCLHIHSTIYKLYIWNIIGTYICHTYDYICGIYMNMLVYRRICV